MRFRALERSGTDVVCAASGPRRLPAVSLGTASESSGAQFVSTAPDAPAAHAHASEESIPGREPRGIRPTAKRFGEDARVDHDDARVRRAILVVLETLASLPGNAESARLIDQAGGLLTQTDGWLQSPPPLDVRDRVMRATLAMHLNALRLVRAHRPP